MVREDIGHWWSPLYVFLIIPLMTLMDPYMSFLGYSWVPFAGKAFGTIGLASVLALMSVDDVGTAIGLQAKERPLIMYEGNPHMVRTWDLFMRWGVKTQTGAHRIIWLLLIVQVLWLNSLGWLGPWARLYILFTSVGKALAGYTWWNLKPNNYGLKDFLVGYNGRITPERRSNQMLIGFNTEIGAYHNRRRRMLHYFFPAV